MNKYYFAVTYWHGPNKQTIQTSPLIAASYSEALESLYKDSSIIGANLIALRAWSGLTFVKPADLYNPSAYDVPDLTRF